MHEKDYMTSCTTDYKYDLHGRLLNETRTSQYNDGTRIVRKFVYLYEDADIVGVIYTNASGTRTYYYDKNPRGDVIGILDNEGNTVVKYWYDAFGNCIWGNSSHDDLARSNPIRYRSYYFDDDTKLYYLNARYYNPEWRRFISPDDSAYLNIEDINGLNLYAYCGNDPVNYSDGSGCSPLPWWGKLLIGIGIIAVLAVATIATAGIAGVGVGTAFAAGFSGSAIGIGASGAAVTIASGAFAGAVVGAGIGFVGGAIGGAISTGTWMGVLDGASSGFMWGSITGAITGGIRSGINYARTTPLIRSVSAKELSSVKTTNVFSSNGAMESKWFATNKLNASKWGNWFGQTDYVGIRVLKSSLKNGYYNPF